MIGFQFDIPHQPSGVGINITGLLWGVAIGFTLGLYLDSFILSKLFGAQSVWIILAIIVVIMMMASHSLSHPRKSLYIIHPSIK